MLEPQLNVLPTTSLSEIRLEPPLTADDFALCYTGRVHRFAAMVTRNGQDSADLAQEALVKAIRALPKLDRSRSNIDAWVWRIVVNTARDAGRVSRRHSMLHDRLVRDARTVAAPAPDLEVLDRLRDDALLAAVRRLPVKPRTIIALRFGGQLTNLEVAEQLRMTPRAVSMALNRALTRLHADLEVRP